MFSLSVLLSRSVHKSVQTNLCYIKQHFLKFQFNKLSSGFGRRELSLVVVPPGEGQLYILRVEAVEESPENSEY